MPPKKVDRNRVGGTTDVGGAAGGGPGGGGAGGAAGDGGAANRFLKDFFTEPQLQESAVKALLAETARFSEEQIRAISRETFQKRLGMLGESIHTLVTAGTRSF